MATELIPNDVRLRDVPWLALRAGIAQYLVQKGVAPTITDALEQVDSMRTVKLLRPRSR